MDASTRNWPIASSPSSGRRGAGNNIVLNRPVRDNVRLLNVCIAPTSGEVAFASRGQGGDSSSSLLFGKKKTHWP